MDDWQDEALSSRHMHNRVGKGGGRSQRHGSRFNVRKSFGGFSVDCPTYTRACGSEGDMKSAGNPDLQLYRLTTDGQGVVGTLSLPGTLQAAVILAASRKSLQAIVSSLEAEDPANDDAEELEREGSSERDNNTDEDGDDQEHLDEADQLENDRFKAFEKNSFRTPKFWLQWCGSPIPPGSTIQDAESTTPETGLGYIVFSGNDCRKFSGTLNCSTLGWEDVAISGHKLASRSESDVPVVWAQTGSDI
ncbi:hypothetical protein BKA67DRAFT_660993 [Truncatella angustata]|uniref:Uncharacterized protein n=1 Tax=Truncatella angustata TaxID=152316 RepID=A0A9P8ZV33_9PEZI|nr:uncharacterized protein BKA67DRAFT_660993 [Truncatella angustata]KAH6652229.1 hypothetical protein BKA67DRAFT_660993 [Truncatella angustata]